MYYVIVFCVYFLFFPAYMYIFILCVCLYIFQSLMCILEYEYLHWFMEVHVSFILNPSTFFFVRTFFIPSCLPWVTTKEWLSRNCSHLTYIHLCTCLFTFIYTVREAGTGFERSFIHASIYLFIHLFIYRYFSWTWPFPIY